MRYIIPLLIFIVVSAFLARGLYLDPRDIPSALIEKPAPEFSLPLLHDPEKRLERNDLLGQVSLFNAWGTWCPTCYQEHPVLVQIARKYGIPIYGLDYKDDRNDAIKWLQKYGNPYKEVAFDKDGRSSIDWGVYAAPETFVVDKQGIIRYKHKGAITMELFTETLLPMIRKLEQES
jgi:cytochrome c biogenesis protein CcmG/thiol:disulfide interchange protein DsbE